MNTPTPKTARLGALLAAAVLALSGCTADTSPRPNDQTAREAVTISDAWVKAAEEGMTAAFGEVHNTGSEEVTIVSARTEASNALELHETVDNGAGQLVMREIADGFVIPAGGSLTLEPGGNHLMLMDLGAPLRAGEEIAFHLTFSDRSTLEFTAVVKDYAGGNETYEHGEHDEHGMHGHDDEHDTDEAH